MVEASRLNAAGVVMAFTPSSYIRTLLIAWIPKPFSEPTQKAPTLQSTSLLSAPEKIAVGSEPGVTAPPVTITRTSTVAMPIRALPYTTGTFA